MQKITLYRYIRPGGGTSVSPIKPDGEYTVLYRLIADEGHTITDGINHVECVDTDNPDAWEDELTDSEALDIIVNGGESDA